MNDPNPPHVKGEARRGHGYPFFGVQRPQILASDELEAYIPQPNVVGSYRHWHPELYKMERYKLAVV